MVTEFGFPDKNDGRYITNVQNYAATQGSSAGTSTRSTTPPVACSTSGRTPEP